MPFNPDVKNQAQEIIFSRKKNDTSHTSSYLNNSQIQQRSVQKHLGLVLDGKFSLLEYVDIKIKKATVEVNFMCKQNLLLSSSSLLTTYKYLFRPHLHHGDVISDLRSLADKIESVQCN